MFQLLYSAVLNVCLKSISTMRNGIKIRNKIAILIISIGAVIINNITQMKIKLLIL